jgi:hypothetical protein
MDERWLWCSFALETKKTKKLASDAIKPGSGRLEDDINKSRSSLEDSIYRPMMNQLVRKSSNRADFSLGTQVGIEQQSSSVHGESRQGKLRWPEYSLQAKST